MTRENKNLRNCFIGKGQIRCIHLNIYIPMHYFFSICVSALLSPNMKKIELESVAVIDMIALPEYGILIADYNKRIIILDNDNLSVKKGELSLEDKPYGLTTMDDHTVAASVGHSCILVVDMHTKVITQTIDVATDIKGTVWGLAYLDGDFFLAATDKIVRINQNSSDYENVYSSTNGWIFYLQIHDRKLFFTNYKSKSFLCATLSGDVLFEYQTDKLKGPYGFTRFNCDSFYVADWTTNRVHKIEDTGTNGEILLTKSDGIFKPRVILYEDKHKSLLIACNGGKLLVQTKRRSSIARERVLKN